VTRHGWTGWTGEESDARRAWRTRTIYRTNLRTSYMAGRWEQLREGFPYLRYRHNTVRQPREQHQAWDGLILAVDDPWWQEHYPPNGWGCNCDVEGISHARMSMLREDGQPDPTPPAAGGAVPEEWAYHVGEAARSMPAAAALGERIMQLPPAWREIALADAQRRQVQWLPDWPGFVNRVAAEVAGGATRPRGAATPLGFVPPAVVDVLASGRGLDGKVFAPVKLRTALVAATDRRVYHSLRDAKFADRPELREVFVEAMRAAPAWMAAADAIVWSERDRALLIARRRPAGDYLTMIVRVDYQERRTREPAMAVWLRTVELYKESALRQYVRVAGEL